VWGQPFPATCPARRGPARDDSFDSFILPVLSLPWGLRLPPPSRCGSDYRATAIKPSPPLPLAKPYSTSPPFSPAIIPATRLRCVRLENPVRESAAGGCKDEHDLVFFFWGGG
jgi:hypothetical protein